MGIYRIRAWNGTGLYLNVRTSTVINGRTDTSLHSNTAKDDQEWVIASLGSNQTVHSLNNTGFMLNAHRSDWNCDVYLDNADTKINFISQGNNIYLLQLCSDPTRYLTAVGTALGSDVNWETIGAVPSDAQKWGLELVASDASFGNENGEMVLPVGPQCNWNQKHSSVTQYFGERACTLVAGLDVANFYATNGVGYTPADMIPYWNNTSGYTWGVPGPGAFGDDVNEKTQAEYLAVIKEEIDQGRPVLVNIGPLNHNHTLFAYDYVNYACRTQDIMVFDPANANTADDEGREDSLYGAMQYNSSGEEPRYYIRSMKLTKRE